MCDKWKANEQPDLFFIGAVADAATGHPGGFNFQRAWSSGCVARQHQHVQVCLVNTMPV
ncbi:NAD(P)/FAD-dependent oxidoreductase [Nitrosomonas sp.]|uniref:NAD(P)/FAD-dependent oxidoreductase n=1 Tax=Nitrosomonas sp. TaxID=42353 RepID=UPI0025D4BADE|nr:NAD(P)/FAD-dependent oxidoreductase [Nitrosomonas sp.]